MSEFAERIDALTIDDLTAAGSLKWTTYPNAIGAWIAEMDFGIAPEIAEVLEQLLKRQQTGYAPMAWRTELKKATSEFVAARYGWQVGWPQIHWLPDVLTGLAIVMTHWLPAGSRIIVPTPCYMPFVDMPGTFGHQRVEVPMLRGDADWTMDLDALDREFAAGARLLVLCNPHNPIGKAFDRAELEAICEVVERHGGLVFSDEIHAPLSYPGVQHVPYASINDTAAAHTVTAMSASKSFNLAGLKCAQLILTNPEHQRFYTTQGHGLPYESTPMGMIANITAFREGGPWLAEVLDYLDGNRRLRATASDPAVLDREDGRRAALTGRMVDSAADVDQRVVAAEASSHARRGGLTAHRVGLAGRRTVHQIGAGPEGHPDVVHDTGERAAGHLVDRGRIVAQRGAVGWPGELCAGGRCRRCGGRGRRGRRRSTGSRRGRQRHGDGDGGL